MEALSFFPPDTDERKGREEITRRLKAILPFFEESLAAETLYRHGTCRRYGPARPGRRLLQWHMRTGYLPQIFSHRQVSFLRNEDYTIVTLSEGLISGLWAVS
jgi:hypothetical protein